MPGNIRPNNNNMWQVDPNEGLNDPAIIPPETGGSGGGGPFAGASHAQLTMNVLHPTAQANVVDWEAPYDPTNGHFEQALDIYTPELWNLTDTSGIFIDNLSSGGGISWAKTGSWLANASVKLYTTSYNPANISMGAWYYSEDPLTLLQLFSIDFTPTMSYGSLTGMGKITPAMIATSNNFEFQIEVINTTPTNVDLAEKVYVQACTVDIYFWAD